MPLSAIPIYLSNTSASNNMCFLLFRSTLWHSIWLSFKMCNIKTLYVYWIDFPDLAIYLSWESKNFLVQSTSTCLKGVTCIWNSYCKGYQWKYPPRFFSPRMFYKVTIKNENNQYLYIRDLKRNKKQPVWYKQKIEFHMAV